MGCVGILKFLFREIQSRRAARGAGAPWREGGKGQAVSDPSPAGRRRGGEGVLGGEREREWLMVDCEWEPEFSHKENDDFR
jgi:hypothetical protein